MSGGLHPSTAVFHYVGNIAFDISGISAKVSYENMWRSHFCSMQSAPCALFPAYRTVLIDIFLFRDYNN